MSQDNETFFTSIGCMDGRVQEPVKRFGQKKFGAQYADTITEAGLAGLLPENSSNDKLLGPLKDKIGISLKKHHSKGIVVHGHQDCAGNPVSDEEHKDNIKASVKIIKSLISSSVPVLGVFVEKVKDQWTALEV